MLTQINHDGIKVGSVIKGFHTLNDEMYIVFEDGTFAAFQARRIFDQLTLDNIHVQLDPTKGIHGFDAETCIELGIITQEEWDKASEDEDVFSKAGRRVYLMQEIERMQRQLKELENG
jgi:hypothetical protein